MLRLLTLILCSLFVSTPGLAAERVAFQPARFAATVDGKGSDVILIPGLASSAEVWRDTAAALRGSHRVHVLQVAGFAGAPAGGNAQGPVLEPLVEELAAYIREEHLQSPAVIGHSMGGMLALMLAARHPELVGRLLVVDSLPFFPLIMDPAATVESARPRAAQLRDATLAMPRAEFEKMQRGQVGRLVKSEAGRTLVAEASAKSDANVTARVMYEIMTTDLRPDLPRIATPTRVLYAYDPVYGVPPEAADAMFGKAYAGLRTAALRRVDGSFHFIMLDQPERFGIEVQEFLRPG